MLGFPFNNFLFLFCIRVLLDFKGIMMTKDIQVYYTICIYKYEFNKKKINILDNQVMMDSIDIKLNFEEHTMGNLLSKYMQKYFTTHNSESNSVFNFVSYIQKHPLDDFVILRLNYDPNISLQKIINYLKMR